MQTRRRVGFYGTGVVANGTHIPNLMALDGVEIVALCDISETARARPRQVDVRGKRRTRRPGGSVRSLVRARPDLHRSDPLR